MTSLFRFSGHDVLFGTPLTSVALCTLWTPKARYQSLLPYVTVIGNLYMRRGIRDLIGNVLEHPYITDIIITGSDSPEPTQRCGDLLLHKEFDPGALFLDDDHVAEFYRRTTLYDARWISLRDPDWDAHIRRIVERVQRSSEDRTFYMPIAIPEISITPPETFQASRAVHPIYAQTIKEAHYKILDTIWKFGDVTDPDSEGRRRREAWVVCAYLDETCPALDHVPHYSREELQRYGEALWNGDEPQGVTYRYGHRMRHFFGDQIAEVKERIRRKPETFRTMISLWEPLESMRRDDEPCLVTVHPRIRGRLMDMFAYIRTNEMYEAWPENASGLRYFQERLVADLADVVLGLRIGSLAIVSGSAHVYDHSFADVERFLAQTRRPSIFFDPKGVWYFSRRAEMFTAEHRTVEGEVLQLIEAPTAERLRRAIAPYFTTVEHALWAGEQLGALI